MVAIDLGAASGRVMRGKFDGEHLAVEEVHRFANVPIREHGYLRWNVHELREQVLDGLARAVAGSGDEVASVGVDAWGLDFALLRAGGLVCNPMHHRGLELENVVREVDQMIPRRALYETTGIQIMPVNSLYQLRALVARDDPVLADAELLLTISDLFHYWLSGAAVCEFTSATTTQCIDARSGGWALPVLQALGLPTDIFPAIVPPGTILGPLLDELVERVGGATAQIVAPASHDTAAAVVAAPLGEASTTFISSGTWSLVGMEVSRPVIDDVSFNANLTNEGGFGGTVRLLRNVTGMWLLEECRRSWAREGENLTVVDLLAMARSAPPFGSLIDPNDPAFLSPGDIGRRVASFCEATGQSAPRNRGALVRCLLESLALKYHEVIELLETATRTPVKAIHIVGGGAQADQLCQLTADASGRPVIAGPVEASAFGNLLVQAIGLGELESVPQARALVSNSVQLRTYEPRPDDRWDEAVARFGQISAQRAL